MWLPVDNTRVWLGWLPVDNTPFLLFYPFFDFGFEGSSSSAIS
jgi:hypothetical protein